MDSLKTAILFYMELYRSGKSSKVLSRICRLMVTLASLQSEQQKELKKVFAKGNTLQQTLDYMESIQEVKVYYLIGCYLLTKVQENHWDMDQLIAAIESRCGGNIESLDPDDRIFLGNGIFPKVIKGMSVEQIIRLLRIFSDRSYACWIMADLKDQMNLPQAARAYWYFAKLQDAERGWLGDCSKQEEEKERIQAIEGANDRCEELLKLAVNSYVHDKLPETEKWLGEAVSLLKEVDPTNRDSTDILENAAELYWNMGKTTEAGKLILEHRDIYGDRKERDFINALCQYGLSENAYGFFEECILPDAKEASEFLKDCVSPLSFLQSMAENGKGETISAFPEVMDRLESSDTVSLLETLIQARQEKTAVELLKTFCAREGNEDCLFKYPKLLTLMRKLRDSGNWTERIPEEQELKAEYLKRNQLEKLDDYIEVQSKEFSPAFQLELIREAWQLFSASIADPKLSVEGKGKLVTDMNHLLTFNSSDLKKDLAPDVCAFLEKVKELSEDPVLFFGEGRFSKTIRFSNTIWYRIKKWLDGSYTLLFDTLDKDKLAEFVVWFNQKIVDVLETGNNVETDNAVTALLSYYISNEMQSETAALLGKMQKTDTEKLELVLEALDNLLSSWRWHSERKDIPLPPLPDSFADRIDAVFKNCNQRTIKVRDVDSCFASFLETLKPYRSQETAARIANSVWSFLKPIFSRTKTDDWDYILIVMEAGGWIMPEQDFNVWFGKLRKAAEDKGLVAELNTCLSVLIKHRIGKEHLEENWYQDILADLPKIKNLGDRNKVLTKLFVAAVQKGAPTQQQDILARMSNTVLIGNSRDLRELDLEKLYGILTSSNISDAAIHTVVKNLNWKELDFDKLCLIAPHMLDEKEYMERWFPALFRKLQENKDLTTMETISRECPELGLPLLPSNEPVKKQPASTVTLDMIAGMDEQIIKKLLALLPEEKKKKIDLLKQARENGILSDQEYANKLSEILG